MAGHSKQRFVLGGRRRATTAARKEIRRQVEREYAERLDSAGTFKRFVLYCQMQREIRRRLNRAAPRDGMYMSP